MTERKTEVHPGVHNGMLSEEELAQIVKKTVQVVGDWDTSIVSAFVSECMRVPNAWLWNFGLVAKQDSQNEWVVGYRGNRIIRSNHEVESTRFASVVITLSRSLITADNKPKERDDVTRSLDRNIGRIVNPDLPAPPVGAKFISTLPATVKISLLRSVTDESPIDEALSLEEQSPKNGECVTGVNVRIPEDEWLYSFQARYFGKWSNNGYPHIQVVTIHE